MRTPKKVILLILDGWGLAKPDKFNAIENAKTPNFDRLRKNYPDVVLRSDGLDVGLPEGQYGTSEINHQVIGAGRVLLQDLPKIDQTIKDKTYYTNAELIAATKHAKMHNSALHLIGVVSDGKVHASLDHVVALIDLAQKEGVENLHIHVFADGRDTPPKSVERYLKVIDDAIKDYPGATIATLQGRFYLDRDRDWDKTNKALDLIVDGVGSHFTTWDAAVNFQYNQGVTDEFFPQCIIDKEGTVKENDAIIFTHYRTDRLFQIVKALMDRNIPNTDLTTFIEVSDTIKTHIAFPRPEITHTLAQTISEAGKKQLHITETEKYTHLTFFFNGGREAEYEGEDWKLHKSNRYVKPFYNLEPTMKAFDITQEIVKNIESAEYDFIVVNFPNTDMVGHTGNYEAAVIAAESVDYCLGKIYDSVITKIDKYALLVTADHGNSDIMWDYENSQPHTQHTTSPVPFIMVSDIECTLDKRESLEDVAPTILDLMQISIPDVMTGTSLIIEK